MDKENISEFGVRSAEPSLALQQIMAVFEKIIFRNPVFCCPICSQFWARVVESLRSIEYYIIPHAKAPSPACAGGYGVASAKEKINREEPGFT